MNDDLLSVFVSEGREQAMQAEQDLAFLITTPGDRAALDRCFRAIHTLKGSAGLFDMAPMSRVLHAAEDVMDAVRSGLVEGDGVFPQVVEAVDQVSRWLDALEQSAALPSGADIVGRDLTARLHTLLGGAYASDPLDTPELSAGVGVAIRYVPRADAYFKGDDPIAIIAAVPGIGALTISNREPFGDLAGYDPFDCNLVIEARSSAGRSAVEASFRLVSDQVELTDIARVVEGGEAVLRTLRVEAERVDNLADVTAELVIAKSGLGDLAGQVERLAEGYAIAQSLRTQQARIDRLVAELHAAVGKIRLTPLAPVFDRLPRLAREIAQSLAKDVRLQVTGGEIQVDKAIVDGLYEPLLHVLRNALDHGVESGPLRRAAGKPAQAAIGLSATVSGQKVTIAVSDDGAGMDPSRIRALAVARGLVNSATADTLDDEAALDLIFLPGFSTATSVSQLSGRGVGMDAVRSAIQHMGGAVEVQSVVQRGTTVRFILPTSMVLTQVLVVVANGERYGLALEDIAETTRVTVEQLARVRAGRAFVLRDQVVPLVNLGELVGAEATEIADSKVVVARVGSELVGIAVDAIGDRMHATVRPMAGLLAGARGVMGSTLLSDGAVLMVLDLQELIA